jgi:hypothetical protein
MDWIAYLVEDVYAEIVGIINPTSALMLGLTSKANYKWYCNNSRTVSEPLSHLTPRMIQLAAENVKKRVYSGDLNVAFLRAGNIAALQTMFYEFSDNCFNRQESPYNFCLSTALYCAAIDGDQIDSLKWLDSVRTQISETPELEYNSIVFDKTDITKYAAATGKLVALQWLHERKYPIDDETLEAALCEPSKLEILDWIAITQSQLLQHGCHLEYAVGYSDVAGVEWLIQHGCVLTEYISAKAAIAENYPMMEWLYNNNCPWSVDVIRREGASSELFCRFNPDPTWLTRMLILLTWLNNHGITV